MTSVDDTLTYINDISSSPVGDAILEKQNYIKTILDNEKERLNIKKQSIDDINISKERMIQLNTNYNERQQQYQKMLIATVIGLAICMVIYFVNKLITIPDIVYSLILIVTVTIVIIYCFNIYLTIINRDPMDFDKIRTIPPVTLTDSQKSQAIATNIAGSSNGNSDLLSQMGYCMGSSCCDGASTKWNAQTGLCTESFEPLIKISSSNFKIVNQNNNISKYTPSEFELYSIYK